MRKISQILQVAFTYMGTIVGAGFASGKEILLFFTRYGWMATATIAAATVLFVWLGTKLMNAAHEIGATSYEDLNKELFGERMGKWISLVTLVVLFGVTSVMLAGAGSLFAEHLGIPYQIGLFITLLLTYLLLQRGMNAILAVNSIVVPVMLLFTFAIVWTTFRLPGAGNWLELTSPYPWHRVWFDSILYTAYNLALAQAVLVPLGRTVEDRKIRLWGGVLGGIGIGVLLLACHYALSARMPGITGYEIPMGHLIGPLGRTVQGLYILVIFGEILTTFLSNVYGIALQLQERTGLHNRLVIPAILAGCYLVSQAGFGQLLEVLYPSIGLVSLIWLVMVMWRRGSLPR
ncbi:YkvI family membrane protein [Gorillibacterium sp. sgz5001074]|uniref:YkvI family membrane protein n=1 Tax=Gorillibacterium sp. sgz5001074 TaxID=3446695 RepID=UPI003F66ACED